MTRRQGRRPSKLLRMIAMVLLVVVSLLFGVAFYLDFHLFLAPVPQKLNDAVTHQMKAAKLPGVSIVVLNKDGVIYSNGFGFADIEEQKQATPDTLYQIASVSKLVTAIAVMKLQAAGHLQLDDDVNLYLPFSVRNPSYPDTPITFRMLLAHASGISDGPAVQESYTLGTSEDPVEPLAGFVESYFKERGRHYDQERNFGAAKPGSTYEYCNVCFALLGYLVEEISKKPFDIYCDEEVFQPLGMTSTAWFNRDIDRNLRAQPYGYDMLRRRFTPLGYYGFSTYPDGALKTNVVDFSRLLLVVMNDGRLPNGSVFLPEQTIQEMLRIQYPETSKTRALAWHFDPHRQFFGHTGGDPGVSTIVNIAADGTWGYAIFANAGGVQGLRSVLGFLIMNDRLAPKMKTYAQQQPPRH